jgi:[ribosomal protein S18]-alanine N-acetyltransferase
MKIRDYEASDLPAIHRIDRACFPIGVAYSLRELREYVESNDSKTFIAENESGRIVGFVVAQIEYAGNQRGHLPKIVGHIVTIDILQEFRGQGIGAQLIERAEQWMSERGAETVLLETATENGSAIFFYKRRGYRTLKVLCCYYTNGSDAYLMAKRLED